MADPSSGVADRNSETSVKKLHQFSPKEVAEELTLMDAELLRKIASEELENGAWMKRDKVGQYLAMPYMYSDMVIRMSMSDMDS